MKETISSMKEFNIHSNYYELSKKNVNKGKYSTDNLYQLLNERNYLILFPGGYTTGNSNPNICLKDFAGKERPNSIKVTKCHIRQAYFRNKSLSVKKLWGS